MGKEDQLLEQLICQENLQEIMWKTVRRFLIKKGFLVSEGKQIMLSFYFHGGETSLKSGVIGAKRHSLVSLQFTEAGNSLYWQNFLKLAKLGAQCAINSPFSDIVYSNFHVNICQKPDPEKAFKFVALPILTGAQSPKN